MRLGFDDSSILQNPDYVLDLSELDQIRTAVKSMNSIISAAAADAGFPVADIPGPLPAIPLLGESNWARWLTKACFART